MVIWAQIDNLFLNTLMTLMLVIGQCSITDISLYQSSTLSSAHQGNSFSFCRVICAAAEVGFMACSALARVVLAASIVIMRSVDTFVTAMLYRMVASRVAEQCGIKHAERASIAFGQLLVMSTLMAALLATSLVTSGAIRCDVLHATEVTDLARAASRRLEDDGTDAACWRRQ